MEGVVDPLRPRPPRRVGDELRQDLGVRGGCELDALLAELVAQPARVRQVAVVAEHQLAAIGLDIHRLDVREGVRAGRAVAGMADRRLRRRGRIVAAVEAVERLLVEDAADQPEALVQAQPRTVADGDARRLLAAVLERVQPDERGARHWRARPPHAHDAALLARSVGLVEG